MKMSELSFPFFSHLLSHFFFSFFFFLSGLDSLPRGSLRKLEKVHDGESDDSNRFSFSFFSHHNQNNNNNNNNSSNTSSLNTNSTASSPKANVTFSNDATSKLSRSSKKISSPPVPARNSPVVQKRSSQNSDANTNNTTNNNNTMNNNNGNSAYFPPMPVRAMDYDAEPIARSGNYNSDSIRRTVLPSPPTPPANDQANLSLEMKEMKKLKVERDLDV